MAKQLTLLLLSTKPFAPSVTTTSLFPSLNSTAEGTGVDSALNRGIPDRGWLSWNKGRIFDPVLAGYRLVDYDAAAVSVASVHEASASTTQETTRPRSAEALDLLKTPAAPVSRPWYAPRVDLRQYGVGVVLDFGLKRSSEDVRAEVAEWRASNAAAKGTSLTERVRRAVLQPGDSKTPQREI